VKKKYHQIGSRERERGCFALGRGTHVQSRKRRECAVVMSSVSSSPAVKRRGRDTRECRARDRRRENLTTTRRPAPATTRSILGPCIPTPETYIYLQVDESLRLPPFTLRCCCCRAKSLASETGRSSSFGWGSARARGPPPLDWIRPINPPPQLAYGRPIPGEAS
jgi:hypothetical protein